MSQDTNKEKSTRIKARPRAIALVGPHGGGKTSLLESIAADPEQNVSGMSLLSTEERRDVLKLGSAHAADFRGDPVTRGVRTAG